MDFEEDKKKINETISNTHLYQPEMKLIKNGDYIIWSNMIVA